MSHVFARRPSIFAPGPRPYSVRPVYFRRWLIGHSVCWHPDTEAARTVLVFDRATYLGIGGALRKAEKACLELNEMWADRSIGAL